MPFLLYNIPFRSSGFVPLPELRMNGIKIIQIGIILYFEFIYNEIPNSLPIV